MLRLRLYEHYVAAVTPTLLYKPMRLSLRLGRAALPAAFDFAVFAITA